ncbi:alpha/beta hydrolase [Altererythrobacter sp. ZODW24]|uniref:alpha/beta fold hydrolase n=1 Tax=Altererythrobacter sp. ZODW24 TaxID=2185142 RepID=UPI000DF749CF|nr:alpha/beta hydrolase [Altererythrobacter sp. ZODW24]
MKLMNAAFAAGLSLALIGGMSASPLRAETVQTETAEPARFTVETIGEGPDVVLIPGLSNPREVWRPNAEKLAAKHRVHLVQIRGFGDDAGANAEGPVLQPFVDELVAYLQSQKIEDAAIVGHSMGGLAAMMIGAQHPDVPGSIMVVDALPFIGVIFGVPDVETITPRAEQMRAMMLMGPQAKQTDCSAVEETDQLPAGNMSNTHKGACMVGNWSAAADKRVFAQAMYDDMVTDMRADIAKITAPMTVVYGRDERGVPVAMMDTIYTSNFAAAPETKFVPVDGSYHFVMLDQPEKMQEALEAFLAE